MAQSQLPKNTYFDVRKKYCVQKSSKFCAKTEAAGDLSELTVALSCENFYRENNCAQVKAAAGKEHHDEIMSCASEDICNDEEKLNTYKCTIDGVQMQFETTTLAFNVGVALGASIGGLSGLALTVGLLPVMIYGDSQKAKVCDSDLGYKMMMVKMHNLSLLPKEKPLDFTGKDKSVFNMPCDDLKKFLHTRLDTLVLKRQEAARWGEKPTRKPCHPPRGFCWKA